MDDGIHSVFAKMSGGSLVVTACSLTQLPLVEALHVPPASIAISDTAAHIAADLAIASSSVLIADFANISGITVSDGLTVQLTEAQALAAGVDDGAGSVLAKTTGGHFTVTGVAAADVGTVLGTYVAPDHMTISDTATNIATHLATLVAALGKITTITVSGGTLTLSAAQAETAGVADGANSVVGDIAGHAYDVTGVTVAQLATIAGLAETPAGITLSDDSATIAADLASGSHIVSAIALLTGINRDRRHADAERRDRAGPGDRDQDERSGDAARHRPGARNHRRGAGQPADGRRHNRAHARNQGGRHRRRGGRRPARQRQLPTGAGHCPGEQRDADRGRHAFGGRHGGARRMCRAGQQRHAPGAVRRRGGGGRPRRGGARAGHQRHRPRHRGKRYAAPGRAADKLRWPAEHRAQRRFAAYQRHRRHLRHRPRHAGRHYGAGRRNGHRHGRGNGGLAGALGSDAAVAHVNITDSATNVVTNLANLLTIGSKLAVTLNDITPLTAGLLAPLLQIANLATNGIGVADTGSQIAAVVASGNNAAITFLNTYGATMTVDSDVGVGDIAALAQLSAFSKGGHQLVVWDTAAHLTAIGAAATLGSLLIDQIHLKTTAGAVTITAATAVALFNIAGFSPANPDSSSNLITVSDTAAHIEASHVALGAIGAGTIHTVVNANATITDAVLGDLQTLGAVAAIGVNLTVRDTAANIYANAVAQANGQSVTPVAWQLSASATLSEANSGAARHAGAFLRRRIHADPEHRC
ncbi:MAG: hypothetical protein WDN04_09190 [Rhodospirillales bacterium]